jgi:hypothetical protein
VTATLPVLLLSVLSLRLVTGTRLGWLLCPITTMARTYKKALVKIVHAIRRLRNHGHNGAINLHRLGLLLRILLLVLVEFFGHLVNKTLVVFRMLQIAFCKNAVTGGRCIARESDIFFIDLISGAANTDIRAVAVKGLYAGIDAASLAASTVIMMVAATAIMTAVSTAAAHTSRVLVMSHVFLFFTSLI